MRKKLILMANTLLVATILLSACATPTAEVIEKVVTQVVKETVIIEGAPQVIEKEVTVEVTAVPEEHEPVTLRIAWWGGQDRHIRTTGAIKLFEQTYPWIRVEYEASGWTDHWTKLSTQAAGGNLPDVMQHDYARIAEWVDDGLILALDDYVDAGILDLSNVAETALAGGRIEGKLYAINLGTNSEAYLVDVDALEAAGLEFPDEKWTWGDFEALCMAYHEATDKWCAEGLGSETLLNGLYMGYGGGRYSLDGKSLGFTDDQPYIDFLHMALRLQAAGAVPHISYPGIPGGGWESELIVPGEAAMAYIWTNGIVAAWTAAGADRNLRMVHVPRPADGCCASQYVKPSMFWSITTHAEHPKEAAMFISFFTNSIDANEILLAERGVPISSVVKEGLEPLLTPAMIEMFRFMDVVEKDNSPIRPPEPPAHSDIVNNVFYPLVSEPVLYEQITPEEGMAIFREEATKLLEAQ
jgi:multiple sugar transport system substrate-binding protein